MLVNTGISGAPLVPLLTFPTSKDFDKFEVGELVQQNFGYITPTADRLAESKSYTSAYNGNNITNTLNYGSFFDGYGAGGGIMTVKNNNQTFRAGCVMSQPEFVDDDIWTKKPVVNKKLEEVHQLLVRQEKLEILGLS